MPRRQQALARLSPQPARRIAALDRDVVSRGVGCRTAQRGRQALGLGCDVTDAVACDAMASVIETWGALMLINNAGISHRSAYIRTDPEVIRA